ncbi:hypothetical protein NDU88_006048 [Pleurodeles waltl]|uniref:Uncharacterized protein n=1 Tax=Pleurodeles waltl TaxID=8319 RepID=A0AAV7MYF8_PLEWA|nr:hypothetical protein NDU88_006048 [Pleurodeles waltl]
MHVGGGCVALCDGSLRSDPHPSRACSDTDTFTTEATREDSTLIGPLLPLRDLTVVKTRLHPFSREEAGSWSWSTPELTNNKERTDQEDADQGDTETAFQTSGTTLGFGAEESRCENEDRGPGEPMIEPPRFRRSVATPSTEVRDGEERSGR